MEAQDFQFEELPIAEAIGLALHGFDLVVGALQGARRDPVGVIVQYPLLMLLQGVGELFQDPMKLMVYPTKGADGKVLTVESLVPPEGVRKVYEHLRDKGAIEGIGAFDEGQLEITPGDVLRRIQSGDESWKGMVPEAVAAMIAERGLFRGA